MKGSKKNLWSKKIGERSEKKWWREVNKNAEGKKKKLWKEIKKTLRGSTKTLKVSKKNGEGK